MTEPQQQLSPEALAIAVEVAKRQKFDKLSFYKPFPHQKKIHEGRDFNGALAQEVCALMANRSGKTFAGASDCAIHLTGRYPDWWQGVRYNHPIAAIAGGVTNETTRDILQRAILGPPTEMKDLYGSGSIPRSDIVTWRLRQGIRDLVDTVVVKHVNGGTSTLQFRSYEMGKDAWMGSHLDYCLLDEEPPEDIYNQCLRAVSLSDNPRILLTFTPENGMSSVVRQFYLRSMPKQACIRASLDDRPDLTKERIEEIISKYPEHERRMRRFGEPTWGINRVFTTDLQRMWIKPFPIPDHWKHIAGIDFGRIHPAAFVWVAYDKDSDTAYVYDATKGSSIEIATQIVLMKKHGASVPWAWPHDGKMDKGLGSLAKQFKDGGANMLPTHAQNNAGLDGKPGGIARRPGIEQVNARAAAGKLRVFDHLTEFGQDYEAYYYKKTQAGKVAIDDTDDDMMSALRYAIMMLPYAQVKQEFRKANADVALGSGSSYDPFYTDYGR